MTISERDVEAQLPLTPLSFQILLALVDEERHGYGIMKEIERRTGLIAESAKRPAPELDDRRRKYYQLTAFGRRVAAAEAERMAYLVGVALDKNLVEGKLTIEGSGDSNATTAD